MDHEETQPIKLMSSSREAEADERTEQTKVKRLIWTGVFRRLLQSTRQQEHSRRIYGNRVCDAKLRDEGRELITR